MMTGRVRSLSSRSGRESRKYCYKGSRQQWHWYYASILGSLNYLPVMNGRIFFPLRKVIFCVQRMRRNDRGRGNRGTALRYTNDCRLQSWGGSRLGAHTNLDRVRKGCVYIKVFIIVAVTGGIFMNNRQVYQASAETRGIQTWGNSSVL